QVQTGLPRPVWQPGGRTGLLPAVLRLVQQRALPHGSGPADTAPGPLRPREGGDRTAQPSARSGVRSPSGTFRPEAADGGRAGCPGLDQPADSRNQRVATLNYDFSCLKGVDTFRCEVGRAISFMFQPLIGRAQTMEVRQMKSCMV